MYNLQTRLQFKDISETGLPHPLSLLSENIKEFLTIDTFVLLIDWEVSIRVSMSSIIYDLEITKVVGEIDFEILTQDLNEDEILSLKGLGKQYKDTLNGTVELNFEDWDIDNSEMYFEPSKELSICFASIDFVSNEIELYPNR